MQSIKTIFKAGNGPSSSHTIGPMNAANFIMRYYGNANFIKVTLFGSLALTGKGHLTDYIIDQQMKDIPHEIIFNMDIIPAHPNTMLFEIYDKDNNLVKSQYIYSIGGGLLSIEGVKQEEYKDIYEHHNLTEIKKYCKENNTSLVDYILQREDSDIKTYCNLVYMIMMESINRGLHTEGVLPGKLQVVRKAKQIYNAKLKNENDSMKEKRCISAYAFAVSEENASGGKIVTAPTCGSCGIIPSVIRYLEEQGASHDLIIDGLLVAGLFGLLVKNNASISGAECGCQAEIGTASSMAAALVAVVKGYSIDDIERAAEIALEHQLGLTCDPVEGYVQIPCIERNAVAALRALESASLVELFGDRNSKISFDVVVETMRQTGLDLNRNYRETSQGGLARNYKE